MFESILVIAGVVTGILGMVFAPRGADYLERKIEQADAAASREGREDSSLIAIGQLGRLLKKK